MTAHYTSKHGQVAKRPEELYMAFTDLRNFARMIPAGKVKADIQAAYPDFTERAIGFKRFSDVLRQMEKDNLLALEMDEQKNMLVKML